MGGHGSGAKPRYDWAAEPVGVESDAAIARRLGCTRAAVTHHRTRRGIPRAPRWCAGAHPVKAMLHDGPYAQLATYAERYGISLSQAVNELICVASGAEVEW